MAAALEERNDPFDDPAWAAEWTCYDCGSALSVEEHDFGHGRCNPCETLERREFEPDADDDLDLEDAYLYGVLIGTDKST